MAGGLPWIGDSAFRLFSVAVAVRIALLAWGAFQDRYMQVNYTDVDYLVFSDAARFVWQGQSPFARDTYRYTPLLAWLLVPNEILGDFWGKVLFCGCDLATGYVIYRHLRKLQCKQNVAAGRAEFLTAIWLLNPLVVNVSTRGNAEGLVGLLPVAALTFFEQGSLNTSAVLLGAATHLKIYPFVYGIPMALQAFAKNGMLSAMRFFVLAATSFILPTIACAWMYDDYMEEAWYYHLRRVDIKHNFAPHFLPMYLLSDPSLSAASPPLISLHVFNVISSVLQLSAVFVSGAFLWWNVWLSTFVQTMVFVAANKVYTVQYFGWLFGLLPMVVGGLRAKSWMRLRGPSLMLGVCLVLWLVSAYLLEFQGLPVHTLVWGASMALLVAQACLTVEVIRCYKLPAMSPSSAAKSE